jgi:hypothetical protein
MSEDAKDKAWELVQKKVRDRTRGSFRGPKITSFPPRMIAESEDSPNNPLLISVGFHPLGQHRG